MSINLSTQEKKDIKIILPEMLKRINNNDDFTIIKKIKLEAYDDNLMTLYFTNGKIPLAWCIKLDEQSFGDEKPIMLNANEHYIFQKIYDSTTFEPENID